MEKEKENEQYTSDFADEDENADEKDIEEEKEDVVDDDNCRDEENDEHDDDAVIDGHKFFHDSDSLVVIDSENGDNGKKVNEMVPIVTPQKTMKLKWNKDADKKSNNKSVEVKAHLRSTKNSSSMTNTTKKQIQMKFPIIKSPDHSMAVSIDFENKRDYIKNFYKWQVEIHNKNKMGKK